VKSYLGERLKVGITLIQVKTKWFNAPWKCLSLAAGNFAPGQFPGGCCCVIPATQAP